MATVSCRNGHWYVGRPHDSYTASGFTRIPGGIILGLFGQYACYVAFDVIRDKYSINVSLDVFAVHGVGGILKTLLVSVLATASFSGLGLPDGVSRWDQFMVRLYSVSITVGWKALISFIILMAIQATSGICKSEQNEIDDIVAQSKIR